MTTMNLYCQSHFARSGVRQVSQSGRNLFSRGFRYEPDCTLTTSDRIPKILPTPSEESNYFDGDEGQSEKASWANLAARARLIYEIDRTTLRPALCPGPSFNGPRLWGHVDWNGRFSSWRATAVKAGALGSCICCPIDTRTVLDSSVFGNCQTNRGDQPNQAGFASSRFRSQARPRYN